MSGSVLHRVQLIKPGALLGQVHGQGGTSSSPLQLQLPLQRPLYGYPEIWPAWAREKPLGYDSLIA